MVFQVYEDKKDGQWRWRLRSANGETIAQGEAYHNSADCVHAVRLVQGSGAARISIIAS